MSRYVETGKPVNKNNFSGDTPTKNEFETKEGTVKFFEQKLFYNYGTETQPVVQEVLIEGPLMKSSGIKIRDNGKKVSKKGKEYHDVKYSMMATFCLDREDLREETQQCLKILHDDVYLGCANALAPFKGKVGLHHFDPEHPEAALNDPVYWPRNENGEVVKGKNPVMWLDFELYGPHKTIITDLKGQAIDWKLLEKAEIELLPLFYFKSVFIGSVKKIKVSLKSAILTKVVQSGSETAQTSSLNRLNAKYGAGKMDEVEAQLAEIRMAQQDSLSHKQVDFDNDFSNEGSMHSMPVTKTDTKEESVADFLASAPSMSSSSTLPPRVQTTLKIN